MLQALPPRGLPPLLVDDGRWQLERDVQTPPIHPSQKERATLQRISGLHKEEKVIVSHVISYQYGHAVIYQSS